MTSYYLVSELNSRDWRHNTLNLERIHNTLYLDWYHVLSQYFEPGLKSCVVTILWIWIQFRWQHDTLSLERIHNTLNLDWYHALSQYFESGLNSGDIMITLRCKNANSLLLLLRVHFLTFSFHFAKLNFKNWNGIFFLNYHTLLLMLLLFLKLKKNFLI